MGQFDWTQLDQVTEICEEGSFATRTIGRETVMLRCRTARGRNAWLRLQFWSGTIVRIQIDPVTGVENPLPADWKEPNFFHEMVVARPDPDCEVRVEDGDPIIVASRRLSVLLWRRPFRIQVYVGKEAHRHLLWETASQDLNVGLKPRILPVAWTNGGIDLDAGSDAVATSDSESSNARRSNDAVGANLWANLAFVLHTGEHLYGLGEKFGPLDKRGQRVELWNRDAFGVNGEWSYKNIPFVWSSREYGIFWPVTGRMHHYVGYPPVSVRSYVAQSQGTHLDFFLIYGPEPGAILDQYTWLTGKAPLPPPWSFGVWMSRCFYRDEAEIRYVAQELRQRGIPCDVLTLDGRAWLEVETRFDFRWDAQRYPHPERLLSDLHAQGFHICVWEYPYISEKSPLFAQAATKGYLLRNREGQPYVFQWDQGGFNAQLTPLPPSGIVDFTNPEAYEWYKKQHEPLFKQGVDVLKTDFGEQVPEDAVASDGTSGLMLHNIYPLLYNRCVWEATQAYSPGGAAVWGRSGWVGSQRYPIQWGGDSQADWEGMSATLRGGLSYGLSGVPFWSHDIGGFYGNKPDPELYVRWAQWGLLSSHARFHGTTVREPWEFGPEAERIVQAYSRLRYRLLPYLWQQARAAAARGLPLMRALALAYPGDPTCAMLDEQYLLGEDLLVAPVLAPGGEKDAYLPAGEWVDFWRGDRLQGPRWVHLRVPLAEIPLFVRAGAVISWGPARNWVGGDRAAAEKAADEGGGFTEWPGIAGRIDIVEALQVYAPSYPFPWKWNDPEQGDLRWEEKTTLRWKPAGQKPFPLLVLRGIVLPGSEGATLITSESVTEEPAGAKAGLPGRELFPGERFLAHTPLISAASRKAARTHQQIEEKGAWFYDAPSRSLWLKAGPHFEPRPDLGIRTNQEAGISPGEIIIRFSFSAKEQ